LLISIGGQDKAINFYDTTNKKKIQSILCQDQLASLALNSDGFTLAVGTAASIGKKGQILIYDLRMTSEEYTS
jgi:WD40 repeat protein